MFTGIAFHRSYLNNVCKQQQTGCLIVTVVFRRVKNILENGKKKTVDYQHFLLYPAMFSTAIFLKTHDSKIKSLTYKNDDNKKKQQQQ